MADTDSLEAEIRGWDELIAERGDDLDLHWREQVAIALMRKSAVLAWELNRPEEAIAVWDEVDRRYADALEPALRARADAALRKKALTLLELKRRSAAFGVYRTIASRRVPQRHAFGQRTYAAAMVGLVSISIALRLSKPIGAVERWAWRVQDRESVGADGGSKTSQA